MASAVRDRIPALLMVALLHAAAVFVFLHALIIEREPAKRSADEHETLITLAREPPLAPRKPRLSTRGSGSGAITPPYFNPYAFQTPSVLSQQVEGIAMALATCDPGRYDKASREVRNLCDRIGLALKNDPGHFGIVSDVSDPQHWQRELARREAPYLAPCMSPNGVDVLYTLSCLYENVFIGYKPEHRRGYSQ